MSVIEKLAQESAEWFTENTKNQNGIAVLTFRNIESVVPVCQALADGGVTRLEVANRSAIWLKAIQLINKEVKGVIVGAGTLKKPEDFDEAKAAGAAFFVSPDMRLSLVEAAKEGRIRSPWLPGIKGPTEAGNAEDMGFTVLKFFPANYHEVKSMQGPYPDLKFCPTGNSSDDKWGVHERTAEIYLGLPNVLCIGGGFLAPDNWVNEQALDQIRNRAREISGIRRD